MTSQRIFISVICPIQASFTTALLNSADLYCSGLISSSLISFLSMKRECRRKIQSVLLLVVLTESNAL